MAELLPSWRDGAAKSAIVDFVARVTHEGGPDFVPPADRLRALAEIRKLGEFNSFDDLDRDFRLTASRW